MKYMIACAENVDNFEKESDMCTNAWIKNDLIFDELPSGKSKTIEIPKTKVFELNKSYKKHDFIISDASDYDFGYSVYYAKQDISPNEADIFPKKDVEKIPLVLRTGTGRRRLDKSITVQKGGSQKRGGGLTLNA